MRDDDPDLRSEDALIRWEAMRRRSQPEPVQKQQTRQPTDSEHQRQWVQYIDQRINAVLDDFAKILGGETTRAILEEVGFLFGQENPLLRDLDADFTPAVAEELRRTLKNRLRDVMQRGQSQGKQKVVLLDTTGAIDGRLEKHLKDIRAQIVDEVRKAMDVDRGKVFDLPALPRRRA